MRRRGEILRKCGVDFLGILVKVSGWAAHLLEDVVRGADADAVGAHGAVVELGPVLVFEVGDANGDAMTPAVVDASASAEDQVGVMAVGIGIGELAQTDKAFAVNLKLAAGEMVARTDEPESGLFLVGLMEGEPMRFGFNADAAAGVGVDEHCCAEKLLLAVLHLIAGDSTSSGEGEAAGIAGVHDLGRGRAQHAEEADTESRGEDGVAAERCAFAGPHISKMI